jgi:hypothetical protein
MEREIKQNKKERGVAYMRRKVFFDGEHTLKVAVPFDF